MKRRETKERRIQQKKRKKKSLRHQSDLLCPRSEQMTTPFRALSSCSAYNFSNFISFCAKLEFNEPPKMKFFRLRMALASKLRQNKHCAYEEA